MKIIDCLISNIRQQAHKTDLLGVEPAAILWTDKDGAWQSSMPLLKAAMPELLELGDYAPEKRTGPAVWLKCVIAGLTSKLESDNVPVIYLPGVSRRELRAIESCPAELVQLAELQYRSRWWATPNNNRDWSVSAFLTNKRIGLELEVGKDKTTQEMLAQVLEPLLEADAKSLQGKRVTSAELAALVVDDPIRDLLHWLDNPTIVADWPAMRMQMLDQYCQQTYGLPASEQSKASLLANMCEQPSQVWQALWHRFEDMAERLPGLLKQLESIQPEALALNSECYLSITLDGEQNLASALQSLHTMSELEAEQHVTDLHVKHVASGHPLWKRLGYTAYSCALAHLAKIVELKAKPLGGPSCDAMAKAYQRNFWQLDYAALQAMACAQHDQQREVIAGVLKAIYTPWLAGTAEHFQQLVKQNGYANAPGIEFNDPQANEYQRASQVVFFVDGLRFDIASAFVEALKADYHVELTSQWSALPSLTATAKAAVTPIKHLLEGDFDHGSFVPRVKETGSEFGSTAFKKLLDQEGWQYLDGVETGDPNGLAWVQTGDLDKAGHKEQLRLPSRIDTILAEVKSRIDGLKQAGWQHIRIVTDHGWLWVPDKMPKTELAKAAASDKTPRCAMLKNTSDAEHLTSPWYWNDDVRIAFAPGISAFRAGLHYEHGGLSLQECLTPVIDIR
ncbi:BREX-1 system phosphatase PglZ type B [Salinibius halmophilus]|uniref:BREX-1 system phosphatase PglZ type B n=1 Tax=Salinibius halmophilus TaxID=1853216 RepID=UPI000E6731CC|nr:BREX-1 system phosphatase PglZ type B [Salinibius halmophilus]